MKDRYGLIASEVEQQMKDKKRDKVSETDLTDLLSVDEKEKVIDLLCDDIFLGLKFRECSNDELVKLAIGQYSDYTMHPIVEEMMDRLSPGWEGKDEDDDR